MHPQIKTNLRHRRAINAKCQPAPSVADELAAALRLGPSWEHRADERGPCLCSQCEFVRAKAKALARYNQERKP